MNKLDAVAPQAGVSLVEALVSLAITMFGVVALVTFQQALRHHADVVRQRAEAVQLAQARLERLRAFTDPKALASQAAHSAPETASLSSNTSFLVASALQPHDAQHFVDADVTVRWSGRQGNEEAVRLATVIAGIAPALSGRLAVPTARASQSGLRGRSWRIPISATDLGDGRSAFRPPGVPSTAWVFDNDTGQVSRLCEAPAAGPLTADSLSHCVAVDASLLSGHVRFATGTVADAVHPASPALDLDLRLALREGTQPPPGCVDDAGSRPRQAEVAYYCLVVADERSHAWSGRLDVTPKGWQLGTTAERYRVCRYSADHDGRSGIANVEHPLDYVAVAGPLPNQNFLVIRGDNTCPAGAGDERWSDSSTVEQAPTPTPTPAR